MTLEAILTFLTNNGMSAVGANQFIHINIPALGGDKSVYNCIQEGNWDEAWGVVESYAAGDYF